MPAGLDILDFNAIDALRIGLDRNRDGIPHHLDLAFRLNPLLKNLAGPQGIPPVNHKHLLGQFGQIQRFFSRAVSPADHHNGFVSEEKPVADCTVRHALSIVFGFAGNVQFMRTAAGADDHGIGAQHPAVIQMHFVIGDAGFDFRNFRGDHLHPIRLGMLLKLHGKLWPADPLDGRIILDFSGQGHLTARRTFFDQDGFQCRPHGVDTGRKTARTAADNN